jgi:hypothetical protein
LYKDCVAGGQHESKPPSTSYSLTAVLVVEEERNFEIECEGLEVYSSSRISEREAQNGSKLAF